MSGGSTLVVDVSKHPLVFTTVLAAPDLDDVHRMQATFEELFARRRPFAAMTDARLLTSFPNAEVRNAIVVWNREHDAEIRRWNVCGSAVLASALARAATRAIHWFIPHPTPYAYVATVDEAIDFSLEHLARAGVPAVDPRRARQSSRTASF